MALLSVAGRKKRFKYLGLGEYNKENIKKFQKKYLRSQDVDGIYGVDTDRALRHVYNVKKYAPNFKPEEFKCECGGRYCTGYPSYMKQVELKNIQAIRTHYGKPITVTCGLRCRTYNSKLNGSIENSLHLTGYACDFYQFGVTDTLANRKAAIKWIKTLPNHHYTYGNGINSYGYGVYAPYMGNALHTDTSKPPAQKKTNVKKSTTSTTKKTTTNNTKAKADAEAKKKAEEAAKKKAEADKKKVEAAKKKQKENERIAQINKKYKSSTVKIGQACANERGGLAYGNAGDQTGREVVITNWGAGYGWIYVYRAIDPAMRLKLADAMIETCKNNNIGYDTSIPGRYTAWDLAEKNGHKISKINQKCETTCSQAVSMCMRAAGVPKTYARRHYDIAAMTAAMKGCPMFKVYKSSSYTRSSKNLQPGDILLSSHHTAIVVQAPNVVIPKKK